MILDLFIYIIQFYINQNTFLPGFIIRKEGEYFAIPGKVPSPEAFYELIFMTEEGMKTFEVSVFEYNVVDVGMEGTLVFQGYQLLSFGDWIKEFSV